MRRPVRTAVATILVLLAACSSSGDGGTGSGADARAIGATTEIDGVESGAELLPAEGNFVAVPLERYVPMWEEPGSTEPADFRLDTRNPSGRLAPLLIDDAAALSEQTWYRVLLPLRPNGASAWVRAADVNVRERTERIEVDLSEHMLRHYEGDELVHRFRVGIGTSGTPTGTGRFYVWVKVTYEDPGNPYGILALGLSGFSPVLSDWPGEGRMAVHGTADPTDRGRAVSHGCVRVYNGDLEALASVPLGTPVEILA